ncbi:hypothetical protein [Anabaenopsis elenkinii]|uniref:Uncharacterized protein n=1 Tax=Anabaenopsis elenkinii CCIBt3563 TaxID=2779889 RepID=A0A7S6U260_9CYAN|nr:hypothetical protein [Anabaenopsis elenkinii]QOV22390.1 hypothetical protein IM676_17220 [Anabaenopsis elenkinii CCIBt3563]
MNAIGITDSDSGGLVRSLLQIVILEVTGYTTQEMLMNLVFSRQSQIYYQPHSVNFVIRTKKSLHWCGHR